MSKSPTHQLWHQQRIEGEMEVVGVPAPSFAYQLELGSKPFKGFLYNELPGGVVVALLVAVVVVAALISPQSVETTRGSREVKGNTHFTIYNRHSW